MNSPEKTRSDEMLQIITFLQQKSYILLRRTADMSCRKEVSGDGLAAEKFVFLARNKKSLLFSRR